MLIVRNAPSISVVRIALACAPAAYFATFIIITVSNWSNSARAEIGDHALTFVSSLVFSLWYGTIFGLPIAMLGAYMFGLPLAWIQRRYGAFPKWMVLVIGTALGILIGAALGYAFDGLGLQRTPRIYLFAGGIAGLITAHRFGKMQLYVQNQ